MTTKQRYARQQERARREKALRRMARILQKASERDRVDRYGGDIKSFDDEYDCIKLAYFAMAKAVLKIYYVPGAPS